MISLVNRLKFTNNTVDYRITLEKKIVKINNDTQDWGVMLLYQY